MADTTRGQLIEQAAQVLEDTYLGGSESSWTLMARALADAGLLADPERRDEFIDWTLGRVRKALGTPDGRAVSIHAAEVRAERDALRARIDAALKLVEGLAECIDCPGDWSGPAPISQRIRAALQDDQPTRPSRDDEILGVCRDALERGWTVEQLAERIRAVYDPVLAADMERRARAGEAAGFGEPPATPPDPSGRITDGGPIQPFTDTDIVWTAGSNTASGGNLPIILTPHKEQP